MSYITTGDLAGVLGQVVAFPPKPTAEPAPGKTWSWETNPRTGKFEWFQCEIEKPPEPSRKLPKGMIWRLRGRGFELSPYRWVVIYEGTGLPVPWYVLYKWHLVGAGATVVTLATGLVLLLRRPT